MHQRSNRRDFLKQAGLAGLGFWVAGGLARAEDSSPNEKLNIACIGVDGKGSSDTDHAGRLANVVALCDIDDEKLNKKAKSFPKAKTYNDFRKLLDEMGKSIDAVTVSTPDHTHAVAAIMAMKMGKHVYCQKPLTHTVFEARAMRETAAKYKVATQMGNQGSASDKLREAVEVVQSGAIGHVREVHVWTNRPIWPQAPLVTSRPMDTPPVPKHVHWDLWLGPAPERPYALYPADKKGVRKGAYHPFSWRGWWDFGTGALGDMACHTCNLPYRALKLAYPVSVVAESGETNPETYPGWARIVFEFSARDDLPPVKFTWYEGKMGEQRVLPPKDLLAEAIRAMPSQRSAKEAKDSKESKAPRDPVPGSGILMVGDKGTLFSPHENGELYYLLPVKEYVDYKPPEASLPRLSKTFAPLLSQLNPVLSKLRSKDGKDAGKVAARRPRSNTDLLMKAEWIAACKGGPPAYSNFDFAGMLTETILLGNVAMRVGGKKLEWDGPSMKFTNYPEANELLQTQYRQGWSL